MASKYLNLTITYFLHENNTVCNIILKLTYTEIAHYLLLL